MKKNPKKPVHGDNFLEYDVFESVSVQECTGLIPSAPQNEYEQESYKDILTYSPDTINVRK